MYRRSRGRRAPVVIGVIVVIVGGIAALKFWPGASTPSPADASTTNDTTSTNTPTGPGPAMVTALIPNNDEKAKSTSPIEEAEPLAQQPRINMGPLPQRPVESTPPTPSDAQMQASNPVSAQAPVKPAAAEPPPAQPTAQSQVGRSAEPAANPPPVAAASTASTGTAAQRMNAGLELLSRNRAVEARKTLTEALLTHSVSGGLSRADADRVRTALGELNQKLVFGTEVAPGDPYARLYAIESGDVLAKLPRKLSLSVDWRFLQRINRLQDPSRIQPGQKLKVVTGPFHAVVNKADYRLDLYMGSGDSRVFVRSFPVGLGEFDATPEGVFMVRPNSKLINPEWVNPRTGERYFADDPNNPIGERWIGLIGVSDNIRDLSGYGIHGTIDPSSIGQMKSMGCVRMHEEDVSLIYEVLMENISRVEIHGEDYP